MVWGGLTAAGAARVVGCDPTTARDWCRAAGVPVRVGRPSVFRQVKLSHLRHVDLAPSVAVSEPPRMSAWRTL